MPTIRLAVRFTGRVQGVGFRATARAIAGDFRVTGWVRNKADGSVELETQGEGEEVDRYLNTLQNRMAHNIEAAHRTVAVPIEGEATFEVRR